MQYCDGGKRAANSKSLTDTSDKYITVSLSLKKRKDAQYNQINKRYNQLENT